MTTIGPLVDLSAETIILNGTGLRADVSAALEDATLERNIAQASTLTLTLGDAHRTLLRSPGFGAVVTASISGLGFVLVKVSKSADTLSLTFEAAAVAALRRQSGALAVAAGTTNRTAFAARLVAQSAGVRFLGWPAAPPIHEVLSRGTSQTPAEDTWTCLQRLASEVQWRCFEVGGTIWFGPDSWLMAQPSAGTLSEFTGGTDFIDFDFDTGKPLATATVTTVASLVAYPPGAVVTLAGMGAANGRWLVSDVTRDIYSVHATVGLTQPQPALPEPVTAPAAVAQSASGLPPGSSSGVGSLAPFRLAPGGGFGALPALPSLPALAVINYGIGLPSLPPLPGISFTAPPPSAAPGGAPSGPVSGRAGQIVAFARSSLGLPYTYGAESPGRTFDCSGLTQAACASAGISIPRVAQDQYNAGPRIGNPVNPGDLVFFGSGAGSISHVGIYIGGGQQIDAPHTGAFVRTESCPTTIGGSWGSDILVGATRPGG